MREFDKEKFLEKLKISKHIFDIKNPVLNRYTADIPYFIIFHGSLCLF